jgi:hypothetical protein
MPGGSKWTQRRFCLLCLAMTKGLGVSLANLTWYRVMPVSFHYIRFILKANSSKRFMLFGQEQRIGQQARPAVQGALGHDPGQFGKIIAFR